jgi:galactokinase/mevalonate kinase-like predicted kinase
VIADAPGRCGILGNPSDIYGGHVLSCSVPTRNRCELTFGTEERLPEDRRLWDAALKRFPLHSSLVRVDWTSKVPRSSGLSGSTALLASTIAAILCARNDAPDLQSFQGKCDFAELVRDVERYDANIMCGYQDAYMIVHGGLQLMDFEGKHPTNPGPNARLQPLEAPLPFLLITTGVERLSGSVHGPMSERWLKGEKLVIDSIQEISSLAEPGAQALVKGDYQQLAEAMNANQRLIRELGGSGESVDALIARTLHHGARAAKLAGAGMGGTIIALTEDPAKLEKSLRADGYERFIVPAVCPGVQFQMSD